MTPLAPHLTAFFEQHLLLERRRSEQTRDSYAYAFKLLLTYASERLKVAPSQLVLEQLDAPLVRDFLNALGHNTAEWTEFPQRPAAIKSCSHILEYRVPSALEQIRQILAIPLKQTESRLVVHLTVEEMQAILDAPDPTVRAGVRDRAMLHLCYAAGLRVSELIGLRVDNLTLQPQARVLVLGKGRRWPARAQPPLMESDHDGAASVAGHQGTCAGTGTLRHELAWHRLHTNTNRRARPASWLLLRIRENLLAHHRAGRASRRSSAHETWEGRTLNGRSAERTQWIRYLTRSVISLSPRAIASATRPFQERVRRGPCRLTPSPQSTTSTST